MVVDPVEPTKERTAAKRQQNDTPRFGNLTHFEVVHHEGNEKAQCDNRCRQKDVFDEGNVCACMLICGFFLLVVPQSFKTMGIAEYLI